MLTVLYPSLGVSQWLTVHNIVLITEWRIFRGCPNLLITIGAAVRDSFRRTQRQPDVHLVSHSSAIRR
jgi:hypothetical protein